METLTNTTTLIGHFGVDSGQAMIGDPSYLNNWIDSKDFDPTDDGEYSYNGACGRTLSSQSAGELHFKAGAGAGEGVVFSTGYGDGYYPVYATYNEDGKIVKVEIIMD